MNHTYRLIWNELTRSWVAVAETVRAKGKKSGAALLLSAAAFSANALSPNGTISAGSGEITQSGTTTTIRQTSQNLAIHWPTFNLAAGETAHFIQPNGSAIALNRVLGTAGSTILGTLKSNGQVWLLNPNGVLFSKGAQVDVGGLVASTLNISDADFMAGRRTFTGNGGKVTNQGAIAANYVALLGEQVKNEGVIVANLGTVAMAAGNKVTLDFAGDNLLGVQIDEGALHALVENKNLIQADGGFVVMTAKAKDALLDTAVNNTGIVRARTIENRAGRILLLGDMDSGTVNVGGTLDASAPNGGDSGFIETSAAHVKVADGARITTQAANGLTGSWLIDPVDFTIAAGSDPLTTSGIGATTLSTSLAGTNVAIATDAGTAGNGDIFVNSAVSWSANKLTLTAHRNININANLNGSGTASLALEYGQGAVAAGNTSNYYANNGAKVYLPAGANFSTKLGSNGGVTNWTVITSLGAAGSVTASDLQGMNGNLAGYYVLGADIDASATAGWNAGAGFTAVGNSGTKFTGNFDGLGHTITGLTINRPDWLVPANNYQGLFGYAGFGSTLRNVGLLNSSIYGANIVGTLAGRSDGAISNSYADGGSVTASVNLAGGLVGLLGDGVAGHGSIGNSYANVSVSGANSGGAISASIGGLVGKTSVGSSIGNSYAIGSVHGGSYVGGLVGQNEADIDTSYAAGAVTATSGVRGGLIGDQLNGTITDSYWDSATTGVGVGIGPAHAGGTVTSLTNITAAPYAQASYAGFDFTNIWRIYEGYTRPLLKSFLTALTVTANDASKTYDGLAYSGGNGVTYSTAPNANLLGAVSYGGTSQGATNVGSYTLTASGLYSNQRGYGISYVDGALTVNQAALTVTANAASKTYDGLAYSGGNGVAYSGFVNGETSAVLGGVLAYGGTSQGAVNAGSYAISPSGLTSGNYAVSFADGTLTIAAVPPAPTSNVPTVPGAPPDGYAGAIAFLSGGVPGGKTASAPTPLLASTEGDERDAAPSLPGVPGLSIIPCGQTLPPAIANTCQ